MLTEGGRVAPPTRDGRRAQSLPVTGRTHFSRHRSHDSDPYRHCPTHSHCTQARPVHPARACMDDHLATSGPPRSLARSSPHLTQRTYLHSGPRRSVVHMSSLASQAERRLRLARRATVLSPIIGLGVAASRKSEYSTFGLLEAAAICGLTLSLSCWRRAGKLSPMRA